MDEDSKVIGIGVVVAVEETDGTVRCAECGGELRSGDGPAKVNTRQFQDGWDRIFGKKDEPRVLN